MNNQQPDRKRVYLAGPMSGYPHNNFPLFDEGKAILEANGFDVVSPADLDREMGYYGDGPVTKEMIAAMMLGDLRAIVTVSGIVLLPGWEKSKGVAEELNWFRFLNAIGFDLELFEFTPELDGLRIVRSTPVALRKATDPPANVVHVQFRSKLDGKQIADAVNNHRCVENGGCKAADCTAGETPAYAA